MIASIISQLQSAQINQKKIFSKVEEAVDLGRAMKEKINRSPVAYVIEVSRRPGVNIRNMGNALQMVKTTVGIVIGVSKINDTSGAKAKGVVDEILKQTRSSLMGFTPTGDFEYEPLLLGAADLVGVTDSALWQLERFTTEHHEESTNE